MTQKERMLAELPYLASDPELKQARDRAHSLAHAFNQLPPARRGEGMAILRELWGKCGRNLHVEPPFHCDYGTQIEAGDNLYINFNCTILDVARVSIGDNVMIAPNVSIYTAGHPLHPDSRNSGYEYGVSVSIGNSVWLGGNVVITGGVSIGDNAVIGAGSVVTRDIPANMLAAGNPCRVIREISEEDRPYYFRKRKFDVEDYQ
ncbi:MAG: sugar O-acetyltransferase [Puniceicoccales bacterium]